MTCAKSIREILEDMIADFASGRSASTVISKAEYMINATIKGEVSRASADEDDWREDKNFKISPE